MLGGLPGFLDKDFSTDTERDLFHVHKSTQNCDYQGGCEIPYFSNIITACYKQINICVDIQLSKSRQTANGLRYTSVVRASNTREYTFMTVQHFVVMPKETYYFK